MRRTVISFALALGLASCATPGLDTPLAGLDLNDGRTLARLQRGLSPQDSGALAIYALRHWPGSRAFCGEAVVDQSGRLPQTVGEAVRLTKAREPVEAAAAAARAKPASQGEQLLEQRDLEISQRDALLARQQIALMKPRDKQTQLEIDSIGKELLDVEKRLREINSRLEHGKQ